MVLNTTFTIPGVPNSFGGWNDKDLHIALVNVRFNNISAKPCQSLIVFEENHEYLENPKCTSDWEVQETVFITLLIKGTDGTDKNKDRYNTAAVTMAHIRLVKSGFTIFYNATRTIQVNTTSLTQPVVAYIIITNTRVVLKIANNVPYFYSILCNYQIYLFIILFLYCNMYDQIG
jgi:hypothetical protein